MYLCGVYFIHPYVRTYTYTRTYIHTVCVIGEEIYFVGIIDYLTSYSLKKKGEHFFKAYILRKDKVFVCMFVWLCVCLVVWLCGCVVVWLCVCVVCVCVLFVKRMH